MNGYTTYTLNHIFSVFSHLHWNSPQWPQSCCYRHHDISELISEIPQRVCRKWMASELLTITINNFCCCFVFFKACVKRWHRSVEGKCRQQLAINVWVCWSPCNQLKIKAIQIEFFSQTQTGFWNVKLLSVSKLQEAHHFVIPVLVYWVSPNLARPIKTL